MIDQYIDAFFEEFILAIAITAGTTVFAYFRSIKNKQVDNALELFKLSQRAWSIEKTMLLLAKLTARQANQIHPEVDTSSLDNIVQDMMKEKL